MIPPTPTYLPTVDPATNPFTIPDTLNLWSMTDEAIQAWRWAGDWGTVLQGLVLIGVVIFGLTLIFTRVRKLWNEANPPPSGD